MPMGTVANIKVLARLLGWVIRYNVMTKRVLANRIWQYHFGRGIVRSANNFGLAGDKPTHPELLDFLAETLDWNGWSLKDMHRLIMTSRTSRLAQLWLEPVILVTPGA